MAMLAAAAAAADPAAPFLPEASIASSLPDNGDPTGIRRALGERGLLYTLNYTNDILSNLAGGRRRGTIDQGLLEARFALDMEKLVGWQGLSLFANAFQIHNTGRMRRDYVGGMNTIAAIEAVPTTRLSEAWIEQKFLSEQASLRIGQLAADTEFFFSDQSAMFMQSDWPTIAATALPSGGPAYPLSTPGVRLKLEPLKSLTVLLAAFNGDPAGPGPGDEQIRNRHGLNFRVRDPALLMGEIQLRRGTDKADQSLATTIKLGGWTHSGRFDDQRSATDGTRLADPFGNGVAVSHRGNSGLYGVIDQQIIRPAGGGPDKGIFLFSRVSISPSDRNLVDRYIDGGVVFAGLVPGRPDDRFGASVIYARFSSAVTGFDRDQNLFAPIPSPPRDFEAGLELTYVAQILPGWTVQPDFQYIWHPSGGRSDAKVIGLRSKLTF